MMEISVRGKHIGLDHHVVRNYRQHGKAIGARR